MVCHISTSISTLIYSDFEMFEQVLWFIKDEDDQYTRKALIIKYILVC
jgi:hypothetical protein